MLVAQTLAGMPSRRSKVFLYFNDVSEAHTQQLERNLTDAGLMGAFGGVPVFRNFEVNAIIAEWLSKRRLHPTLTFIDPYGYHGLTQQLIGAVIKDWGSDALIFFHTSGIARNLGRGDQVSVLTELFGEGVFEWLQSAMVLRRGSMLQPVLTAFKKTVEEVGGKYFHAMQFNFPNSRRISHHLIFVSKDSTGFGIIKEIMAKYSVKEDGIPTYTYAEGCDDALDQQNFPFTNKVEDLRSALCSRFADKSTDFDSVKKYVDKAGLPYPTYVVRAVWKELQRDGEVARHGRRSL